MDVIKFRSMAELEGRVQAQLKRTLGRGIYIQEYDVHDDIGKVSIELGNAIPKDVSDRREQERVLKFINIRGIHTLEADSTGDGYYILRLPDRSTLYQDFTQRRNELVNELDYSVAQAIYDQVYQLTPVKNQLNGISQIVRWVLRYGSITIDEIAESQNTDNTRDYIEVLDELSYLEVSNQSVTPGEKIDAYDLTGSEVSESHEKAILGGIVKDGYYTLRDRLGLNMLSHYPKYSNAYYATAIQRHEPDLWLDVEAIRQNLEDYYHEEATRFTIDDKMKELADVGIIEKDGDYVQSTQEVYTEVEQTAPAF